MGNFGFINSLSEDAKYSLTKKFNLEDMIHFSNVNEMFRLILNGCDDIAPGQLMGDSGYQCNNNSDENKKQNMIAELNELYTAGLCNPEYYQTQLKETRFEKYFNIHLNNEREDDNDANSYQRTQMRKFFLLYAYISPYYTEESKGKDDFLKKLAKESEDTSEELLESFTLVVGMTFSFSLLKELKDTKPDIIEKSLTHMHASLMGLKTGVFREKCFDFSNKFEDILNNQRDFLVSLIEDPKISQKIKELALKIILLFGNIRESGEDYLTVFNLLKEHKFNTNIYNELRHNSHFEKENKESLSEDRFKALDNYDEKRVVDILTGLGNDPNSYKN